MMGPRSRQRDSRSPARNTLTSHLKTFTPSTALKGADRVSPAQDRPRPFRRPVPRALRPASNPVSPWALAEFPWWSTRQQPALRQSFSQDDPDDGLHRCGQNDGPAIEQLSNELTARTGEIPQLPHQIEPGSRATADRDHW
jgi:hypothetical protein